MVNGKANILLHDHPVLGDMLSNIDNMEFSQKMADYIDLNQIRINRG